MTWHDDSPSRPVCPPPVVSVITASLNAVHCLGDCMDSVAAQRGITTEHIVIDGGSQDGTVDLLKNYTTAPVIWKSEPDSGIADAMNKGADAARGAWLLFLQADDRLATPKALVEVLESGAFPKALIVACGIRYGNRPHLPVLPGSHKSGWPLRSAFKQPFRHQGLLVHRQAWDRVGPYDTRFTIVMDFDWLLRAYRLDLPVLRLGYELAHVATGGLSSARQGSLYHQRLREEQAARLKNSPNMYWNCLYKLFWLVYWPYRVSIEEKTER